jgi:hypothetical protein
VAEARKLRPGLAVIVASGYSANSGPRDGALDNTYSLGKPFDLAQLKTAIERA